MTTIQEQMQSAQEAWKRNQRIITDGYEMVRDGNIDFVVLILEIIMAEQQCLSETVLTPVIEFVCKVIPFKDRKTTKKELVLSDLENMSQEDIVKLYEWLTEKVDSLSSKLKPDSKDEEVMLKL